MKNSAYSIPFSVKGIRCNIPLHLGYNPDVVEKVFKILKQLREFDVTKLGDLYLTTGGRVVLDRGYGEYFTKGDKKIFTLTELKRGINYSNFVKKIVEMGGAVYSEGEK